MAPRLVGHPVGALVTRWPRAFPQYDVGHLARADRIDIALAAEAPGLFATGAAFRGVGMAACIREAAATAARLAPPAA